MLVDTLLEASYRSAIHRAISHLRRRNPTGYAQALMGPFGIVPSYVEEDPNHPWWSSEEAMSLLQSLHDAAYEGVKPGGQTPAQPSDLQTGSRPQFPADW